MIVMRGSCFEGRVVAVEENSLQSRVRVIVRQSRMPALCRAQKCRKPYPRLEVALDGCDHRGLVEVV